MNFTDLTMQYYREHRKAYIEYINAQNVVNDIVNEYLVAFQRTQPHSPVYTDAGTKANQVNRVEEYVIEVEHKDLKRRAEDATMLLDLKQRLVDIKEKEVRKSCSVYDAIYVSKWIDHKKPKDIILDLDLKGFCYSSSQVYEIIKRLEKEIEK